MGLDARGNDMQSSGKGGAGESSLYSQVGVGCDAKQTRAHTHSLSFSRHTAFAGLVTVRQFKPERLICKGTSAWHSASGGTNPARNLDVLPLV